MIAARPGIPSRGRHRVRRGAEGKDVEDHRLIVPDPLAVSGEPRLRLPAHENAGVGVPEEVPVGPVVDRVREGAHRDVQGVGGVEVLPAVQDPGHEQRGVDGGDLATPRALGGSRAEEVVEEPLVADVSRCPGPLRSGPESVERGVDTGAPRLTRDPAVIDGGTDGGKAEAGRRDAGRGSHGTAILDQAVGRVRLFPEEPEGRHLERVHQSLVAEGVRPGRGQAKQQRKCQAPRIPTGPATTPSGFHVGVSCVLHVVSPAAESSRNPERK